LAGERGNGVSDAEFWVPDCAAGLISETAKGSDCNQRSIEMPVAKITSCAFGGEHMDTLFVTTASVELRYGRWIEMDDAGFAEAPTTGGIFAIDVGVTSRGRSPSS
jgi:SMP-30/Gluconolactonase/LRE-like region